ncbi:hypothetical protein QBK99_18080 [Corticibacterium sp. UT-5YL-CI-8]|nr:hypothetical protein [Tianweitania sp. UT-5YL-CI-8]
MAELIGAIVGATLGIALLGALLAWVARRLFPMPRLASYLVGVVPVAVVAPFLLASSSNPQREFSDSVLIYLIGGFLAFAVLYLTSRRSKA